MSDAPQASEIRQQVTDLFQEAPVWYLATCHAGEPNVIPVGYKWIEQGSLLIADYFFKIARDNIAANPRVAVSAGLLNPKRGYQIKASPIVHRTGPVFDRVCELMKPAGYKVDPWAAIQIPMDQIYLLHPGPDAGKRLI